MLIPIYGLGIILFLIMLHRFASQFVFCSPFQILKRVVVEQNDIHIVTRIFDLNEGNVESAQTLFFDGVLSIGIVSLKMHSLLVDEVQLNEEYNYIDLAALQSRKKIIPSTKPLLLDFSSDECEQVNKHLSQFGSALKDFSVFDIIAACTYYPSHFLNFSSTLEVNHSAKIHLWEGIDLFNKSITNHTQIRQI